MTKDEEISLLQAFATRFDQHSYLGPFLTQTMPGIVADIRNDHPPFVSLADMRANEKAMEARLAELHKKEQELRRRCLSAENSYRSVKENIIRLQTDMSRSLSILYTAAQAKD